ncbi:MAG: DUF2721 domain-containing protein [Pirellulaceae bacterium]|nr:DUF2721 domain-containing protein [Planctomycetales bacterium]MCA9206372.1 DUF2721 domain-containing protein [Planctomycetales bacterium]MCA9209489.1 DUF2721 domain-containing protein [Planctomycetales bacterium]MCA9226289.1 DUF2721 domain-containing protein [Planctomycetales bacterium]
MTEIIAVLQVAIGPVILISGVGLLLLTMTNRLGRCIDRVRQLVDELPRADEVSRPGIEQQLRILWKRARLIRLAIGLASLSALCASLLIITLFFVTLLKMHDDLLLGSLFTLCLLFLLGSLAVFLHDINQSLAALRLELAGAGFSREI